jgi:hypothetical protein
VTSSARDKEVIQGKKPLLSSLLRAEDLNISVTTNPVNLVGTVLVSPDGGTPESLDSGTQVTTHEARVVLGGVHDVLLDWV